MYSMTLIVGCRGIGLELHHLYLSCCVLSRCERGLHNKPLLCEAMAQLGEPGEVKHSCGPSGD